MSQKLKMVIHTMQQPQYLSVEELKIAGRGVYLESTISLYLVSIFSSFCDLNYVIYLPNIA